MYEDLIRENNNTLIADKIKGKILQRCENKFRTDLSCSLSAITFGTSTK